MLFFQPRKLSAKSYLRFFISIILLSSYAPFAFADFDLSKNNGQLIETPTGKIFVPKATEHQLGDSKTIYAHPHYLVFIPNSMNATLPETPASLACIYNLVPTSPGCNPATASALPTGGWGTIALIDAYDDAAAEDDLNVFSERFGLPACTTSNGCFTKLFASGHRSESCEGTHWCAETSLDIEWAHAMAPHAKILLVEADDNSFPKLGDAEFVASEEVAARGGGEISNSWGLREEPDEIGSGDLDLLFQYYASTIIYFASTGDFAAPPEYPAVSPYLIAAGGSHVIRDAAGNFLTEYAWGVPPDPYHTGASAGGPSLYEPRPAYQNIVQKIVGTQRGTPDISFDGDPQSGVLIYDSIDGGWFIVGGTSVASPSLAGIVNVATGGPVSTSAEQNKIYSNFAKRYTEYWREISSGYNGYYAMNGYNFVTGIGTPLSYQGK